MKHFLSCLALGLLAIGLSACSSAAQSTIEPTASINPIVLASATPKAEPIAPAANQRSSIKLEDCTIGNVAARCGTYRVYENRSAIDGRQIDLKIAVLPATGAHAEPDPLFHFTGGPGGAATDLWPDR